MKKLIKYFNNKNILFKEIKEVLLREFLISSAFCSKVKKIMLGV